MLILTSEILQDLYLVQRLTETEIGNQFGLGQVAVGRLRKKWGIRSMTKGERAGLGFPTLTDEQTQVLIGSLLGDGHLSSTGGISARFSEGHSMVQAAYTDWKGNILTPFTTKFFKTLKREKEKNFESWWFVTTTCPQFRPFYDLFYPIPERKKVFPANLPMLMTPLVLAVWYMDDGGVTSSGAPRISFGLDDLSRERSLKALRKLGLDAIVYGTGGDQAFHFPKQAMKFREIVEPFILPCMSYKIPIETERQAGDRNARKLTSEKASSLYEAGMAVSAVAAISGVGVTTVARRLKDAGVSRRRSGPVSKDLTQVEAASILKGFSPERWKGLSDEEKGHWVSEIKGVLRRAPFPSEPVKDSMEVILEKMKGLKIDDVEGVIQPLSRIGTTFCASFFPGRYKASWNGIRSAFEAWYEDKELERAIRFQLDMGDPVLPHRVLRAVSLKFRTPTVFRPTVAMFMCRKFLPAGGVWWDPCAGYGGRLLGAVASGIQYVGTDIDQETVEGCLRLASVLGAVSSTQVICSPAEEFTPPSCGLVFTSPPYFNREQYSKGAGQSWVKYGQFDSWVEGFLRPVIQKAKKALDSSKGILALNVADIGKFSLVAETAKVAKEEGFVQGSTLSMPLSALNRNKPFEPILVFHP